MSSYDHIAYNILLNLVSRPTAWSLPFFRSSLRWRVAKHTNGHQVSSDQLTFVICCIYFRGWFHPTHQGIIAHKYPLYKAYISGFPIGGYVGIGVHHCLSPEPSYIHRDYFQKPLTFSDPGTLTNQDCSWAWCQPYGLNVDRRTAAQFIGDRSTSLETDLFDNKKCLVT